MIWIKTDSKNIITDAAAVEMNGEGWQAMDAELDIFEPYGINAVFREVGNFRLEDGRAVYRGGEEIAAQIGETERNAAKNTGAPTLEERVTAMEAVVLEMILAGEQ